MQASGRRRPSWARSLLRSGPRFLVCLCLLLAAPGDGKAQTRPRESEVVARFEADLLAVMRSAETTDFAERYRRLQPEIERAFDLPVMTRIVVGSAWTALDDLQRQRLIDAFRHFVIATYARRFDGYAGEQFSLDAQQPAPGGILVKTRLIQVGEAPIELDYLTHDGDQGPHIIDVFLAGTVSELATRRSEFSSVLRQTGYDGLIAALRQKANG